MLVMKVEDYPVIKKLNNLAGLLPDNALRNELYEICRSLLLMGASIGAMTGFAGSISAFHTSKYSERVLDRFTSELKEWEDYLANEAKKFI